ncbi:MAG: tail fiber domain-containing protein, partial [Candidatus Aenigmatarchaeota archaeon]
ISGRNGNVGIGTTAPATKLEVQGGALCVRSGTGVSCNTTSGAISAQYFYYISDLRLKTNIQPIENALPRLLTLNGVSYETIYDGTRSLGLIAQEVEKVFPEVVNTDKETGLKWIDYGKLVPVLIEAIKEQQREIEKLKAEIETLKK